MNIYHFTREKKLYGILNNDKLKAGDIFKYGYAHKTFKELPMGEIISFTRNFSLNSTIDTDVCLVFDRDKISQNYKLIPYNDYPNKKKSFTWWSEAEEIINATEIKLSRYIKEIIIFKTEPKTFNYHFNKDFSSMEEVVDYIEKTYDIKTRYIPFLNTEINKRKYMKSYENFNPDK